MRLGKMAKNTSLNLRRLSEEELQDLHDVLLMILDDLICICKEHKLCFMLIGGSAIGALRHGGFIPWDDDIDIAMPRADFDKLFELIHENYHTKYSILHPQRQDNHGRILPKLRLKNTEYRTILEYDLEECGVFIDIYPIENIPDHILYRIFQGSIAMTLGFALSCRRIGKGYPIFKTYQDSISFKAKAGIGFLLSFASIEQWVRWTDHWYSKCKKNDSKYVGVPTDEFHYFGEIYERKQFCRYREVLFEGRRCRIPQNYDAYLQRRYGDYMIPPDKDRQERNGYLVYDLGDYTKRDTLC